MGWKINQQERVEEETKIPLLPNKLKSGFWRIWAPLAKSRTVIEYLLSCSVCISQFLERYHKMKQTLMTGNSSGASTLLPCRDQVQPKVIRTKNNQTLVLRGAYEGEIGVVEQLVRECAEAGEGFNMDEFSSTDGHFLHKFILEPHVFVAVDSNREIKGFDIHGFSGLTRVQDSLYTAYFFVLKSERRQGIASELFAMVYDMAKQKGCQAILFDVYINNQVTIQWLMRQGLLVTGCLPHCGYLANVGYTHSLLMMKKVADFSAPDILANL